MPGVETVDGYVKVGFMAVSEDGNPASTIEGYNLYDGLVLKRFLFTGIMGTDKRIYMDLANTTKHETDASIEFASAGLLDLRFDHTRLHSLGPSRGGLSFAREATGLSANVTPARWLRIFGGLKHQEKAGERTALLSDGLDFPGTKYDYSINSRSVGGRVESKGRSVDLNYEHRDFGSESNALLDREGHRIRTSFTYPVRKTIVFSGSYLNDENLFKESEEVLRTRTYAGTLTLEPTPILRVTGFVDHKNTRDDVTDRKLRSLTAGGKATVKARPFLSLEGGYEYSRRSDEDRLPGIESTERELNTNSFLAGASARLSNRARLTLRFRTRNAEKGQYAGLSGPLDVNHGLARLEGWATPDIQYSLSIEDRERTNDELLTSIRTRGISGYTVGVLKLREHTLNLRLSGSIFNSEFSEQHGHFETDNILVSATVKFDPTSRLSLEAGMTHVGVRKDLDIRKDIALASVEYELNAGYAVEVRYDLLSYDDFETFTDNYAANVLTLSFSKKFSAGGI